MKTIHIAGVGGIGGFIGARLCRMQGDESFGTPSICFVARGAHLEAIKRNGLAFRSADGEAWAARPSAVASSPAELPPPDLVFMCVKGYDLEGMARAYRPQITAVTAVVPLLNGVDIYERLRAVIERGVILPACIYISSTVTGPGSVTHIGGKGLVILGRDPFNPTYHPAGLFPLLEKAGIPFEWHEDAAAALWTKYLFIASFAMVTAAGGKSLGQVISDAESRARIRAVMEEILALAVKKGISLPPDIIETSIEKARAYPFDAKTSYQRDIETPGRQNEGELFGATILRLGRQLGVATPVTAELHRLLAP